MLKHNKKRNVGLIREFFIKFMAESVVNGKKAQAVQAKNIWNKYFEKGTELNKEFFTFKSLLETNISNKDLAFEFLKNARADGKKINSKKLNEEKTALIREVNASLSDKNFFEREIENYTIFASIQICLDHWINKGLNEGIINPAIVELEDKLLNHLLRPITEKKQPASKEEITSTDHIVIKLMMEKFNKKFCNTLTESQQNIIKTYAFDNDPVKLKTMLESIKNKTLLLLNQEISENKKLPPTQKQKFETIKNILETDYKEFDNKLDENTVVFFMSISKLFEEFTGE